MRCRSRKRAGLPAGLLNNVDLQSTVPYKKSKNSVGNTDALQNEAPCRGFRGDETSFTLVFSDFEV